MKKYTAAIFQIIILITVLYFVLINLHNVSSFSFSKTAEAASISTSMIILCVYAAGLFAGALGSLINKGAYRSQIEFYSRKNEKLQQQNEIDTDDKEVLQRKIAALEIALDNALKNKN